VTLSTIHSVKGLDYSCVFLVGLDLYWPKLLVDDRVKNLVYVGMTRARHRLFIPYVEKSELIDRLLGCLGS
jgi:superfamily I DNA/RNA helicase